MDTAVGTSGELRLGMGMGSLYGSIFFEIYSGYF